MRRIFFQCHFAIMGMNDGLAERKPKPKTSAAVANRIAPGKEHFKQHVPSVHLEYRDRYR